MVAFTLVGIINFVVDLPVERFRVPGVLSLGIIFVGYLVLSLAALVHSFLKAAPRERAEEGLNFMFGGVVIGLLPLTLLMVAGMFVRTDLLPGTDFLFLTLVLSPISIALALLKGGRDSLQPVPNQSG